MKELLIEILNTLKLAFWVEIITDNPKCTYYFGPFLSKTEANQATQGYLEDLKNEGAEGIKVDIKRVKPTNLTIFDELTEKKPVNPIGSLSGQTF